MQHGNKELMKSIQRYAKLRQMTENEAMRSTKFPKNIILLIGDGMSLPTVAGARMLKNQKMSKFTKDEQELIWEGFPESALMKVCKYLNSVIGNF